MAILIVSVLGLLLGLVRGSQVKQELQLYNQFYGKKVRVQARVLDDVVYADKGQIEFNADVAKVERGNEVISLPGKIMIRGYGEVNINRYDSVNAEGVLLASRSGSRQGNMSFATIEVISRHSSMAETLRRKFVKNMQSALPEPLSSFALGLLVGQKSTLNKTVSDELSTVGLSHVIAVSGYNLTIIVGAVMRLLCGRSKYQILALCLSGIGAFLLITGSSPSIIRAAWVSGLSLLAWYYGRNIKPHVLVLLTAAITALVQPLYVYGDLGWYLSVLAFFGILCLAPPLHGLLFSENNTFARYIVECVCAQLMTLPLIVYVFGKFATLGLLSNIIIAPLVPFAMFLSLIAALPFGISHLLALCALPAKLLLTFMLDSVHLGASINGANLAMKISKFMMIGSYCVLFVSSFCLLGLARRKKQKLLEYY